MTGLTHRPGCEGAAFSSKFGCERAIAGADCRGPIPRRRRYPLVFHYGIEKYHLGCSAIEDSSKVSIGCKNRCTPLEYV